MRIFGPIKLIRAHILLPLGRSAPHHIPFFGIEEPGLSRVIGEAKPDRESAHDTKYPLDNINPSI